MASVANAFQVRPLCEGLPFGATVAGLTREPTGALPGRLVRGAQSAPAAMQG